jgi:septum formation topological specificity factor MinE
MFQPLRDEILIALRRDIFEVVQNFIKENNIEYNPLNAFKLNIINNEISIYFDENFQRVLINY